MRTRFKKAPPCILHPVATGRKTSVLRIAGAPGPEKPKRYRLRGLDRDLPPADHIDRAAPYSSRQDPSRGGNPDTHDPPRRAGVSDAPACRAHEDSSHPVEAIFRRLATPPRCAPF